jgi:hypothetical protein
MITDMAFYRYRYYHTAADTPDKLTYDAFARATEGPSAQLDRLRSVEAEQESLHLRLRQRTLLMLLAPPVPGHALWLVHGQSRGHEQHQQAASGVEPK